MHAATMLFGGVASTSELLTTGATRSSITRAAKAGQLSRLARGIYCVDVSEMQTLELAARFGTLSHTTAAHCHGFDLLGPPGLHVTSPHRRRSPPPGVRVHRGALADAERVRAGPFEVTAALRTIVDCARLMPLVDAVVVMDSALRSGALSSAGLTAASLRAMGRGAAGPRKAALLADGRSESALESITRLLFLQHGLTPQLQVPIYDGAGFVARVDFLFDSAQLIVETDGYASHGSPEAFQADRRRQNALLCAGYRVVRFSWQDVTSRPDYVIATVRSMLGAVG
jgi:very-short-patch-repair endonuclease